MKRPHSYLLNAALASGVLYFAYDLSRSGRTAVVGWVALMIAVADSIALYRKERVAGESARCQRVRGRREP